jgi:hypothetical protein
MTDRNAVAGALASVLGLSAALGGGGLFGIAGCRAPREAQRSLEDVSVAAKVAPAVPEPTAHLPRDAASLRPAMVELEPGSDGLGAALAEAAVACESCHAEIAAQWRESAHAAASFDNPLYRVSVEGFRDAQGGRASRMCGGCHDVALLVDGAMDEPVRPDDRRAHAGVSCLVCHGVVEARPDGNGSYRLRGDEVPLPVEGDPASLRAHRRRMASPALRTAELCGSCHRSFVGAYTGHDHHLTGVDDLTAWRRSIYARASTISPPGVGPSTPEVTSTAWTWAWPNVAALTATCPKSLRHAAMPPPRTIASAPTASSVDTAGWRPCRARAISSPRRGPC